MLSALGMRSLELVPPSGRSGHLESPDCKKGWVCAVAAPQPLQPAGLTEFWQQFPAQSRTCPSGGEAAADVSVGPQHQPQPRRGPVGLWAGVLCFVFWPDPGKYQCGIYSWAFSVPVQALIQLQLELLKPFSRCPVEGCPTVRQNSIGVFTGCAL